MSYDRYDNLEQFDLHSHDGIQLVGYHWPCYEHPRSPMAVLILIHGVAEHCGRYERLVQFYNEYGIAVISFDLRGHGQSGGRKVFIPTPDAIFTDLDLLIQEAKRRYSNCPAILYGHSMGGTLALSYTLNRFPRKSDKCPYQAMVVTSPWIRLAKSIQPPRPVVTVIRALSRVRPSFKVPLFVDPRSISRDEDVVYAYSQDPQIRKSATLSLARIMGGMAIQLDRTISIFHIPVLIQHGDADLVTSHNASLKFSQRGQGLEFKSWPLCFHELHNEPEREQVFQYTLDWIRTRIPIRI